VDFAVHAAKPASVGFIRRHDERSFLAAGMVSRIL